MFAEGVENHWIRLSRSHFPEPQQIGSEKAGEPLRNNANWGVRLDGCHCCLFSPCHVLMMTADSQAYTEASHWSKMKPSTPDYFPCFRLFL